MWWNSNLQTHFLVRGQNLTVVATGVISDKIDKGTKIAVKVKLNGSPAYSNKWDFCESAKKAGATCPVEKQTPKITKVARPLLLPVVETLCGEHRNADCCCPSCRHLMCPKAFLV